MKGLITDRERENVLRRAELAEKGIQGMTAEEQAEWMGDPTTVAGTNLMPPGPYYSSAVELKYYNESIVATATEVGVYLYAISIIGEAAKYTGKTFTLSLNGIYFGGGTPQISLYWHDDNGFEYAGASLSDAGSVTFTINENVNNRTYLAAYVYVTTDVGVGAGDKVRFVGLMLEEGNTRHDYVPYTELLPTSATKGAYNYSDLNRVERSVAEISDEFGLSLKTKTDWTMWDVPRISDMERYLNNVKAIRNTISSDIALPESMSELTYSGANNIEKVLSEAYRAMKAPVWCGDVFCGEL